MIFLSSILISKDKRVIFDAPCNIAAGVLFNPVCEYSGLKDCAECCEKMKKDWLLQTIVCSRKELFYQA
ncbi:MAG: hypothetical protein WC444_04700 [Candidatus Paceibacterota bacterium]